MSHDPRSTECPGTGRGLMYIDNRKAPPPTSPRNDVAAADCLDDLAGRARAGMLPALSVVISPTE
ncbi:hypothetical protein [Mycobacterium xenopi]|nr:hypothetical protein [Mycobacterium xenopi]MDA3641556.1 hypothetical protein [Mycobacterium xenopi]MDA3659537.1 hypothetical protein [Mycobacterium xenopi]MDA3664590.1 hypothetical protein [Mycobacterium xenopi]